VCARCCNQKLFRSRITPEPGATAEIKAAPDEPAETDVSAETAVPAYKYFANMATTTEAPSEIHQAVIHFVLHPAVPTGYRLKYLLVSVLVIAVQVFAILGLLASVEAMGVGDILSQFHE
jgi:hypothetical protein